MNIYRPWAAVLVFSLSLSRIIIIAILSIVIDLENSAIAQVATSITPTISTGNLSTTVTAAGHVYNITGGTRAGTNLFHSFGSFSVGAADTANFFNIPVNGSLPLTSSILGRVTGGNVSSIFGTIQTTDFERGSPIRRARR
jgi:large exoprotein involved in heme utilization and adhesion